MEATCESERQRPTETKEWEWTSLAKAFPTTVSVHRNSYHEEIGVMELLKYIL